MENFILFSFKSVLGVLAGGAIGAVFAIIQQFAKERYEKRQKSLHLSSAWPIIPGSMTRTAVFIAALVAVQVGFPALFESNLKWLVSAGVVLGYAMMQLVEYRKKLSVNND